MATSLPPVKPKPDEAAIEAMINRGVNPAGSRSIAPDPLDDDDAPHHINTRLSKGIVRQIDALRAQRGRKPGSPKLAVSQQDWLLEAVLEKISRDTKLD